MENDLTEPGAGRKPSESARFTYKYAPALGAGASVQWLTPLGRMGKVVLSWCDKEKNSMNVHISERWEPYIRSAVQSGRFATPDAVIDEAMRLLNERERETNDRAAPVAEPPIPAWKRVLENMA